MSLEYSIVVKLTMSEKFCLKWNDFNLNVSKSFSKLRHDNDFYDVTLVSDDQKQVLGHKVVLSACSEYFKNILKENRHLNPLLCLEGIKHNEINQILDYIYYGEVKIYQDDLDRFLNIAERLKLEGLMSEKNDAAAYTEAIIDAKEVFNDTKDLVLEDEVKFRNGKEENKIAINSEEYPCIAELDAKILEHIEKDVGGRWICKICAKSLRFKTHAKEHVEIHFDGLQFPCLDCGTLSRSRRGLRDHISSKHKAR